MIRLQAESLSKTYRRGERPAVSEVSFELPEGGLLSLVGESGSGKTTLLRLIAGLERPDGGRLLLDGREISSARRVVEVQRRGIGLVFQHHALFPHLSVAQNLTFGLRRHTRGERQREVDSLLELVGLRGLETRFPHELSGGERQRVALARALAPRPRLLLLDEPFSSLDARLRQSVRDETRAILQERGATALLVTHDTTDALSIADHLVILRQGVVQQEGTPAEVYFTPANSYVALFFGRCNFLPTDCLPHPVGARIQCHVGPPGVIDPSMACGTSGQDLLWVRPEDLELTKPRNGLSLQGVVQRVAFHGAHLEVELICNRHNHEPFTVTVRHHQPTPVQPGQHWAIVARRRTTPSFDSSSD